MDKLLPCAFCGSENLDDGREPDYDHVLCLDCRASGPGCDDWRIAQAAWNRRAPAPPDPALLALARLSARLIHRGQQPGFGLGELLSADASDSGVLDDDGFLVPGVAIAIRALLAPNGAGGE